MILEKHNLFAFIDNELNQLRPKYHHALMQYNHVLMQRNNILKSVNKSPSLKMAAEVFGEQLSNYGSFISEVRYEFIKKLALISRLMHRKITNGKEELEITYDCSIGAFEDINKTREKLYKYYIEIMLDFL